MAPNTTNYQAKPVVRLPGSNSLPSLVGSMQQLNIKENHNGSGIGSGVHSLPSRNPNNKVFGGKKVIFQNPPMKPASPLSPLSPVTNYYKQV